MAILPENVLELINENLGGFNTTMGIKFTKAEMDEFAADLIIGTEHLQPYGLVHGGLYAGIIETVCSTGAALNVMSDGRSAVGLENSTSFLHAVRSGTLTCTAKPLVRGRRSHVWEAAIHDDSGRVVATGRVRLMILEQGSHAGGEEVALVSH